MTAHEKLAFRDRQRFHGPHPEPWGEHEIGCVGCHWCTPHPDSNRRPYQPLPGDSPR